jgi:hypothetical protein
MDGFFDFTGTLFVLRHHWFWMLVSLGLGVWVGWHTAIDRPHYKPPEAGAEAP